MFNTNKIPDALPSEKKQILFLDIDGTLKKNDGSLNEDLIYFIVFLSEALKKKGVILDVCLFTAGDLRTQAKAVLKNTLTIEQLNNRLKEYGLNMINALHCFDDQCGDYIPNVLNKNEDFLDLKEMVEQKCSDEDIQIKFREKLDKKIKELDLRSDLSPEEQSIINDVKIKYREFLDGKDSKLDFVNLYFQLIDYLGQLPYIEKGRIVKNSDLSTKPDLRSKYDVLFEFLNANEAKYGIYLNEDKYASNLAFLPCFYDDLEKGVYECGSDGKIIRRDPRCVVLPPGEISVPDVKGYTRVNRFYKFIELAQNFIDKVLTPAENALNLMREKLKIEIENFIAFIEDKAGILNLAEAIKSYFSSSLKRKSPCDDNNESFDDESSYDGSCDLVRLETETLNNNNAGFGLKNNPAITFPSSSNKKATHLDQIVSKFAPK